MSPDVAPPESSSQFEPPSPMQSLRRDRGSWRNVVFGFLLIVATLVASLAFGWHGIAVQSRKHLSTEWLLRLIPHEPGIGTGPLMNELIGRIVQNHLEDEQLVAVLRVCVRGDRLRPPGSEAWRHRYGRLVNLWRHPTRRPQEERVLLFEVPPEVTATAPPVWPTDGATPIAIRIRDYWPRGTASRVRVEFDGALPSIEAIRLNGDPGLRPLVLELPAPPPDEIAISLWVHIDRLAGDADSFSVRSAELVDADAEWTPSHSIELTVPIGQRAALADSLLPLVDSRLDDSMREVFATGLLRWRDETQRVAIQFQPHQMIGQLTEDYGVGVIVELLENDVVRRRSRIWWVVAIGSDASSDWDPPDEDDDAIARLLALELDDPRLDAWSLRVTAAPALALRGFGSSERTAALMTLPARYWSGTIEVPLTVRDQTGRPPSRSWHWSVPPSLERPRGN